MLGDSLRGVPPQVVRYAEPGGHRLADNGRIVERGQLSPACAGGEGRPGRAGHGQGQPGFPGSARSRQREQPAARQAFQHIPELALPSDQRNKPGREPPGIQRRRHVPCPSAWPTPAPALAGVPVAHRVERPGPGPGSAPIVHQPWPMAPALRPPYRIWTCPWPLPGNGRHSSGRPPAISLAPGCRSAGQDAPARRTPDVLTPAGRRSRMCGQRAVGTRPQAAGPAEHGRTGRHQWWRPR